MRRIGRWMLNALTVLSLLLCVLTCVMWVWSYRIIDSWSWGTAVERRTVSAASGDLLLEHLTFATFPKGSQVDSLRFRDPPGFHAELNGGGKSPVPPQWSCLGVEVTLLKSAVMSGTAVRIPDWPIVLLTAAAPCLSLLRKARPAQSGHCASCSYDLTGNVSGVCPECGTKIAEAK